MSKYNKEPFWLDNIGILFKTDRLMDIIPLKRMDINEKLNAILRLSIYYSVIHYLYTKNSNILFIPIVVSVLTYVFYVNNVEKNKVSHVIEGLTNKFSQLDIFNLTNKNQDNVLRDNVLRDNVLYESNNDLDKNTGYGPDKYVKAIDNNEYLRMKEVYDDDDCKLPEIDNPFGNVLLGDIGNPKFKKACSSYDNNMVKRDIKKTFEDNLYMDVNDVFAKHNSQRQFYTMPVTDVCNEQTEFAKWCYLTPPTCKEGNGAQCSANLSAPNGLNVDNLLLSHGHGNNPTNST